MLSAARRSLVASAAQQLKLAGFTRSMALSGVKGFDEHESAVENLYFNKEDERILRKILGKVKNQAEQDETAKAQHAAADEAALRQILAKYSVADHDIKALLHWKHATY